MSESNNIKAESNNINLDAVCEKVLSVVSASLSDMKPGIIEEISKKVRQELEPMCLNATEMSRKSNERVSELERQVSELKKQISALEKSMTEFGKLFTAPTNSSSTKGSPTISNSNAANIQGVGLIKCGNEYIIKPDKKAKKVQKGAYGEPDINGYVMLRFNGWLFYQNRDMGDLLYLIREDGSCNTQISDSMVYNVEVSHGYICFRIGYREEIKAKIVED